MKSTYLDSVWFTLILDAYTTRSLGMAGLENSGEAFINEPIAVASISEDDDAMHGNQWREWWRVKFPIIL